MVAQATSRTVATLLTFFRDGGRGDASLLSSFPIFMLLRSSLLLLLLLSLLLLLLITITIVASALMMPMRLI